jgi:hypothetical protein
MHPPKFLLGSAVVALLLTPATAAGADEGSPSRTEVYADASTRYGVPLEILLGVSFLESRWDTNAGTPSTSGGFGPMHLTDAGYVASLPTAPDGPPGVTPAVEDRRGDESRPLPIGHGTPPPAAPNPAALQTLARAAELTGASEEALRTDPAANIHGGAALLRAYQQSIAGPTGAESNPADWYGAVARYSGAESADAAKVFADEVFRTIADGAARTTDDGQPLTLAPRAITPNRSWLDRLHLRRLERPDGLECPVDLSCEWLPAPYQLLGDGSNPTNYGNHDLGNRPAEQKIQYIVIHDTEGSYETTLRLAQDPEYVSWQYTMRSVDGHIAQHVKANDVAWHAGNWYVNAKAIGIEHEGFAAQGTWYTESMYRSSAKLVRYLALRLGIPLDRQHIIGHDNVSGTVPSTVSGMHWDPGPYWDWSHYFDLLKAPFRGIGTPLGGIVTIKPDYATNRPAFVGCSGGATNPCPSRGSTSVILHTEPRADAPLLKDVGLRPSGAPSTMHISDHGSRVETGQQFALAGRQGDWTAIWYLGQKGWFYNPASAPSALWSVGFVVRPKAGRSGIPVYGRAYPEAEAYPAGVPYQTITPLQYSFPAGQRYVLGMIAPSEYYRAVTFDGSGPGAWTVIRGQKTYAQVQFGHRVMYVDLADVDIVPSVLP